MKHKMIGVLVLLALLAGSFVFAGGGQEGGEMAAAEGPQYGGTFNFSAVADAPSPSIADAAYGSLRYLDWIQEKPVAGDTWTYGPRGTGDYNFTAKAYQPDVYLTGRLLESWEVNFEKLTWNVRPGINWAADNVDFMENREVTADDLAQDIIRFLNSPWKGRFDGLLSPDNVKAIDKYTLEMTYTKYSPNVFYFLGYEDRAAYSPPEPEEAGPDRWENQVGTGAFMFDEYVTGSFMRLKKNPNYWDKAVIDGKEYDLPFIDEVIVFVIPDQATALAALTTGKIDWHQNVGPENQTMVESTAPHLLKGENAPNEPGGRYVFRNDVPPFDSTEVRRAVYKGTNIVEFQKLHGVEGAPLVWQAAWPGHPAYVPLEDLPRDIKTLYDYDPEKAKKMLADAGYPNGFKTAVVVNAQNTWELDEASLLKDQWAKIGVDVEIKSLDNAANQSAKYSQPNITWDGLYRDGNPTANPVTYFGLFLESVSGGAGGSNNYGMYSNPDVDALIGKMNVELDPAKQTDLVKQANEILLRDPPAIPLAYVSVAFYWSPWIQNYYGELTLGDDGSGFPPLIYHAWIDQAMKKEMGF